MLALLACGEASDAPRQARRLATLAPEATDRTLVDVAPDWVDTQFSAGQLQLTQEFDTTPGERYVVSLHYRAAPGGLGPTVFGGAAGGGPLTPLGALAGGRSDGRLEVELEAGTTRSVVEARMPRGPVAVRESPDGARLLRLVVSLRPDPYARVAGGPDAGGLAVLDLYRDLRPGWVLRLGDTVTVPEPLPVGATRVTLALASARHLMRRPGPPTTLELVLRAVRADGLTVELGRTGVTWDVPLWQTWEVPLDDEALGAGAHLHLFVEGPVEGPGARPGEDADVTAGLAVSVPVAHVEAGPRRPNLVLVSIDTLRRDRLGTYGYDRPTTPQLDALAERALVFEDAVAAAPYTLPSHATMLSGQYPGRHGAQNPAHALNPARTLLLAERLAAAGWATRAATGGGYLDADYGFARGFSSYGQVDPVSGAGMVAPGGLAGQLVAAQDWSAALDWIEDRRQVPFFLFLQTFAVHDYQPPPEWRARFDRAGSPEVVPLRRVADQREQPYSADELAALGDRYDAGLAWVDDHVGALLARLDALDLTRHTIVVITSDHGEAFGERGLNGHGHSLHAEQLQVPLLLSVPGLPARRLGARVSLVDLTPTLLDLLGVSAPDGLDGRSLRPLWEDADAAWQPSPVLAEVDSNVTRARALYDGPAKLICADTAAAVELPAPREREFYDTAADPDERRDLLLAGDPRAADADLLELRLEDLFGAVRAQAEGGLVPADLDDDTRRRLAELGYLDADGN